MSLARAHTPNLPMLHNHTRQNGAYLVTPEVAREFMGRNFKNRPIHNATVTKYAGQMKDGKWLLNGETIIIANTGRVLSGQHRFLACIESNTPFPSFFVFGMDENVFATLDDHAARSLGDHLAVSGMTGRNDRHFNTYIASSLNLLFSYDVSQNIAEAGRSAATREQFLQFFKLGNNAMLQNSVDWAMSNKKGGLLNISMVSFMHFLGSYRAGRKLETEEFLTQVRTGIGLSEEDPAYRLRMKLEKFKQNKAAMPRSREYGALALKALRLYLDGKKVPISSHFRVREYEKLPKF